MRRTAKINAAAKGSYDQLQAELSDLTKRYKALSAAERQNANIGGKMMGKIQRNTKALKQMDKTMGNHQRNVGNYSSAVGGLSGQLNNLVGAYLGFAAVRKAFRFVGESIEAYDKQITRERQLESALGGNVEMTKRLLDYASELQGMTIYGDEETIRAAQSLAQAGLKNEQQMKALLPLALSSSKGYSLTNSSRVRKISQRPSWPSNSRVLSICIKIAITSASASGIVPRLIMSKSACTISCSITIFWKALG